MQENSKNRGGAREGSGRKPLNNKRKPVTVYVREDLIEEKGIDSIKELMISAIHSDGVNGDNSKDKKMNLDKYHNAVKNIPQAVREEVKMKMGAGEAVGGLINAGGANESENASEGPNKHRLWREGDPKEGSVAFFLKFNSESYDDVNFKR